MEVFGDKCSETRVYYCRRGDELCDVIYGVG